MSKQLPRRKCKCQVCGKSGINHDMYRYNDGKRNLYYCNKDEFVAQQMEKIKRDRVYKFLSNHIFTDYNYKMLPPVLKKEINALADIYNYDVVLLTLEKHCDTLHYWMNLEGKFDNGSAYGKVAYFMTIIKNNINPVWKEWRNKQIAKEKEKEVEEVVNLDIFNTLDRGIKKEENIGIMRFLQGDD